jgi:hypothetical protein
MNPTASRVNELHQSAMDFAEGAALAKLRGAAEEQQSLLQQALEAETQAAALLANQWTTEPSRAVIHRSAASLALQCGERGLAEQLVVTALMGSPPAEIAEELRDLFVQINLGPFLERRGLAAERVLGELQLAGLIAI